MLIHLTNTNSAPAEAAILPGASAKVRAQVARELVRVRMTRTETSDIGRGYGWLSVGRMRSKDIYLKARARGACDPRRLSEKNLRFAQWLPEQQPQARSSFQVVTQVDNAPRA